MAHPSLLTPELRVPYWIDGKGEVCDPVKLSDLGKGYKVIFCFKASCPGCHSRGFPAMKKMVDNLRDKDFGFIVIHTAFDDDPFNSQERILEMQKKYALDIPFGHDPKVGDNYPTFMVDYQTRGTPYFIILNPKGELVFSDFNLDPDKVIATFSK